MVAFGDIGPHANPTRVQPEPLIYGGPPAPYTALTRLPTDSQKQEAGAGVLSSGVTVS
jgi:hypothetical protein